MLKETPRALIMVLDSEGKQTNYELEIFQTWEADGPDDPMVRAFSPKMERKELTPDEAARWIGQDAVKTQLENNALRAQVAELQQQLVDAGLRHDTAVQQASTVVDGLNKERDEALSKAATSEDRMKKAMLVLAGEATVVQTQ